MWFVVLSFWELGRFLFAQEDFCEDLNAPPGTFIHWVASNLPPGRFLQEGAEAMRKEQIEEVAYLEKLVMVVLVLRRVTSLLFSTAGY